MARFYFHFANGQTILDHIGTDLPDLDAVRKEALGTTRELMFDASSQFWAGEPHRLWVTDQPNSAGKTILSLQLSSQ
jgi:hypothetical protein